MGAADTPATAGGGAGTGPEAPGGRRSGIARRRPRLGGRWLAAAAFVAAAGAQAQTEVTLVSNASQTTSTGSSAIQSQPFSTGSHAAGYTVTSAGVWLDNVDDTPLFRIVPNASNGEPDLSDATKFVTLTNPSPLAVDAENTFTAPAGTTLAADTTYHLYLTDADGDGPPQVERVTSSDEDDGGADGWSIGDTRYWRNEPEDAWSTSTSLLLRMKIKGYANSDTASTDATLSALTVNDGTNDLTLDPTFASGTYTYEADVVSSVTSVTLTATPNDSGASVTAVTLGGTDIADTDFTDGIAVPSLAVGDNVIVVTVTAEDTITTQAYTLTVTRAATYTYVSNLTLENPEVVQTSTAQAQTFTTGTYSPGYDLGFVDVNFNQINSGVTLSASVYSTTGSDPRPDAVLVTLTTPSPLPGSGFIRFMAPAGTTLDAETTYAVVVDPSANVRLNRSSSNNEVEAKTGWSIGNAGHEWLAGPSGWNKRDSHSLLIRVRGSTDASDEATLSALTVNDGTNDLTLDPVFESGTDAYATSVDNAVTSVTLTATPNDSDASVTAVTLGGTAIADTDFTDGIAVPSLVAGANEIVVTVTAEDGAMQTYTVTVTRAAAAASDDATLSALTVKDATDDLTLDPAFASGTYAYEADVGSSVAEVTLIATPNHADASVTGVTLGGTSVADTDFTDGITVPSLVEGANEIVLTVTAEDGNTTQTYTVTVTRAAVVTDTTAPSASGAAVDGTSLVITFDEPLAAAPRLANDAFTVEKTPDMGTEETVTLVGSPAIDGATVTLTLDAAVVATDTDVKVSYAKPTTGTDNVLEDAAGNEVADFTDRAVTNNTPLPDTDAPEVALATVDGTSLVITFDEPLAAAPSLANDAFTVEKTPNMGSEETVALSGSPAISGATVTLTLATGVVATDTDVKVSYAKPTTGADNVLEDADGNAVADFADQAVTNATGASCTEADLRLIGGDNAREGSLQICHNEDWRHVCDDHWDKTDADVACRQLGYPGAQRETILSEFVSLISVDYWLDDVECTGDETTLSQCPSRPWGQNNCQFSERAGAVCKAGSNNLAALSLAGPGGGPVVLMPGFDPATTEYAASVPHGVALVTVSAEPQDDGATVAIADDDDSATPREATLDLDVGDNDIGVTVNNGGSDGTYTVTVTRAAAPAADCPDIHHWCATLTVGEWDAATGDTNYGYHGANGHGSLGDATVEYDGATYTIGALHNTVGTVLPGLWIAFGDNRSPHGTFHAAATEFAMDADSEQGTTNYRWNPSGLSWSDGDTVTLAIAFPNSDASGKPTLSGPPQVGMTLTADVSGIADADGLAGVSYAYQWLRDGSDIAGATDDAYTLVDDDEREKISVRTTFTDDAGNAEARTSDETYEVAPAAVSSCDSDTVWCATLTTGHQLDDDSLVLATGFLAQSGGDTYGSVSVAAFQHLGVDYTVTALRVSAGFHYLSFSTSPNLPADGAGLTVHVQTYGGERSRALADGVFNSAEEWFFDPGLTAYAVDGRTLSDVPLIRGAFERVAIIGEPPVDGTEVGVRLSAAVPVLSFANINVRFTESAGMAELTVNLDRPSTETVTVDYETRGNTAIAGRDYTAVSDTLTFDPGVTSRTIEIDLFPNDIYQRNTANRFNVELSNPVNADLSSARKLAQVNIVDDDLPPTASIADVTVAEDAGTMTLTLALNRPSVDAVEYDFGPGDVGGTAVSGTDYAISFDSQNQVRIRVPAGDRQATFDITVNEDHLVEADEMIVIDLEILSDAAHSGPNSLTFTGTILDNDSDEPALSFGASEYIASEGDLAARVTLNANPAPEAATTIPLTVTHLGGATAADYSGIPASLTFAAGEGSKSFDVTATDDAVYREGRSLRIGLGTLPAGVRAGATATATVALDDDDARFVNFQLSVLSAQEGTSARVGVRMTPAPDVATPIPLTVTPLGGATAADYSGIPASLTFAAGESLHTFDVAVIDDAEADPGESVRIGFGPLPFGVLSHRRPTATVAFADNDAPIETRVSFAAGGALSARESGGGAWVRVFLDEPATAATTIPLTTAHGGSATAADYTGVPAAVTFAEGEDEASFNVYAVDDDDNDDGESVTIGFGPLPSGVGAGRVTAQTVNLVDDDGRSEWSVWFGASTYTATEGGSPATVSVELDAPVEIKPLTVQLLDPTYAGGATAADHSEIPGSVTFAVGEQRKTFTVTATDDAEDDDNKSLSISIGYRYSDPDTARLNFEGGPQTTRVLLEDDDGVEPVTVSFGSATYTAMEGGAGATVRLDLDVAPGRSVTVPLTVTDGDGVTAADYAGIPSGVTFGAQETSRTFTVTATDDAENEDPEIVQIGFGVRPNGVLAGSPSTATVTLEDDDGPAQELTVRFGTHQEQVSPVREGRSLRIAVKLDSWPDGAVTVPLLVTHLQGASAADYSGIPSSVTFEDTQEVALSVRAVDDTSDDDFEVVRIGFGALPAGMSADRWRSYSDLEIVDNDGLEGVKLEFWKSSFTAFEGGAPAEVYARLNRAPGRSLRVPLRATPQGGATASDYSVAREVLFGSGDTWGGPVTVTARDDDEAEDGESVVLSFGSLPEGVIRGHDATGRRVRATPWRHRGTAGCRDRR